MDFDDIIEKSQSNNDLYDEAEELEKEIDQQLKIQKLEEEVIFNNKMKKIIKFAIN